jgi:hypothetical protein
MKDGPAHPGPSLFFALAGAISARTLVLPGFSEKARG